MKKLHHQTEALSIGEIKAKPDRILCRKRIFLSFLSMLFILILSSSCGRNAGLGCGTWPGLGNNKNTDYNKQYGKQPNATRHYSYYKR